MSVAESIRVFFRELFGSRMLEHVLQENATISAAYEVRINDLKQHLVDLKIEKQILQAKVAQLEQVVLPYASRAGADLTRLATPNEPRPQFSGTFSDTPKTPWQIAQEEFNKIETENNAAKAGE